MGAEPTRIIRADTGPPGPGESRRRRRRHLTVASAGAAIGLAIGIVLVLAISSVRSTGSWSDAPVFLFGLPALLLVGGGVVGTLMSMAPEATDVDAPVRDPAAGGRAATSEQGQLPGSPVRPDTVPAERGRSRIEDLPSQRDPDADEAGREVEQTEWAERGPRSGPREY